MLYKSMPSICNPLNLCYTRLLCYSYEYKSMSIHVIYVTHMNINPCYSCESMFESM